MSAPFQGSATFTITGGVAGSVTLVGGVLANGTYNIAINQDNSGTWLAVTTPYGATGAEGFDPGDDIQ